MACSRIFLLGRQPYMTNHRKCWPFNLNRNSNDSLVSLPHFDAISINFGATSIHLVVGLQREQVDVSGCYVIGYTRQNHHISININEFMQCSSDSNGIINLAYNFHFNACFDIIARITSNGVKPNNIPVSQMSGVYLKDGMLESTFEIYAVVPNMLAYSSAHTCWIYNLFN